MQTTETIRSLERLLTDAQSVTPLSTLPRDCQERIANLSERREHAATMQFTADDAAELAAWEAYLAELHNGMNPCGEV